MGAPARGTDRALAAILAAALGLAASCRAARPASPEHGAREAGTAPTRAPDPGPARSVAGTSVDGRPIEVLVFGDGPDTVLIVASIHGDEAAGTPLVEELARRLARGPAWLDGRRAILVPTLNPDGVADDRRENRRGVDLNRNFPAANRREREAHGATALSEPESRALHALVLAHEPDRIVSIHQPASRVDYDGPALALAEAMAAAGPLPLRRMGARPGSLGSWAGVDRGIAVITLELPRPADRMTRAELWDTYGAMLVASIRAAW